MKNIFKYLTLSLAAVVFYTSCEKVEDLAYYGNGKEVTLTADRAAVTALPADSNSNVINFSWTNPEYKQDSSLYKFILEIDSAGRNFSKKATKTVTGVRKAGLTGKELNAIVLNYGFSLGVAYDMDVRLISSYGNNNERYVSNVVKIKVTPYNDPSVLTTQNTSVTGTLATASQPSNTFSWTSSFNGYAGNVTYTLQYDSAGKNFVAPVEIPIGNQLYSKTLTQGEMNETALNSGIPGGNSGKVEYRVKAVTDRGATSYSNVVNVTIQSYLPILRLYLPGSYQAATGNGVNWDPPTAPELIRDTRPGAFNNLYYIYIYLPAGTEFKVTQGRSWDLNYGGTGGNLSVNGANFSVTNAGYYRISVDRLTMKYDIREGRMGFVGGATGANWEPANTFPNYAMGAVGTNLFIGLTDLTLSEWKLIDNNQWNNGDLTVVNTRSYGSSGPSGSAMEINGGNFGNPPSAGRYRVIWDGRNRDGIKYNMTPATEMRVVGNGINQAGVNDWDPPTSPQMAYMGNGVWQITLNLKADREIKFLAGNAWGAFDYEDNSGGNQSTGVSMPIQYDGGPNFRTPLAAGSYTITLNEHTQRVTIN